MTTQLQAALEMLKRLPSEPQANSAVCEFLTPAQQTSLRAKIGTELVTVRDPETGVDFIGCSANSVGEAYRSPLSGKLVPGNEDAVELSMGLRKLEIYVNSLFREYVHSYYNSAISSVYFSHSTDKAGFSAFFAVLKGNFHLETTKATRRCRLSCVHVVEMLHEGNEKKQYQVASRMNVVMTLEQAKTEFKGAFATTKEEKVMATDSKPEAEGMLLIRLIEDNELTLRRQLENFVAARMPGVLSALYSRRPISEVSTFKSWHDTLMTQLLESGLRLREADS